MEEIWKDIKDFEGLYKISNLGRIINQKGMLKKGKLNSKGYEIVSLSKNGKQKYYLTHRLVAKTFIKNTNNMEQVNHKDENKLNNCVNNLEWCDSKYNLCYGTRMQRIIKTKEPSFKKIKQKDLQGNVIKIWKNISEIKKETNFNKQCIHYCCNGRLKTSGGYKWEYC